MSAPQTRLTLVPVDDEGATTSSMALIPVDDSGNPLEQANDTANAYEAVMDRPGAAVRSFIQGRGLKRGYENFKEVPRFQDLYIDATNKAIDKIPGINRLPEEVNYNIRALSGMAPSAAGFAIDSLTNPAELAMMAVTPAANKAIGNLADAGVAAAKRSPNMLNTLLKGPKSFEADILAEEAAAVAKAAKTSNYIRQNAGKIFQGNTEVYGNALDTMDSSMQRGNLVDAMTGTLEKIKATGDPNLLNKPAYSKLISLADEHSPNTQLVRKASTKRETFDILKRKQSAGEFVSPDEFTALELTPEESMAMRNPRHIDDLVDARTVQQIRRELRAVAGKDPVSRFAADSFDLSVGEAASEMIPELKAVNARYGPVLSAKYKALRKFNPTDRFSTEGEKFLSEVAHRRVKGLSSPTDEEFLRVLGEGNAEFAGLGPEVLSSVAEVETAVAKAARIRKLKGQQEALRKVAAGTAGGVGLFNAGAIGKSLGLF